ncbi:uncharacterized protein [Littorina saxatilis]|uniref:uncharacterized protein n=1 Tax=Littorina saxatilis TaxID=31220 RepID=UPI0038B56CA1
MTTSASCPARGPLLQDGYLSCGNTPWENGTKVTHQFRVKRDTFPALCPVSPTNREVRFERAPNRTGPYQRRCTVQDLTKACTGAFKPGTLGCGCIEISGSSFLVEYTFVARPEDSGWWRGSLDCYDADLASPLLSFGSNDNCHDRRVVLPGSSDTSSDGGSGGSGYGSVGLGNDTDQNTNTTGLGANGDTDIDWFTLYAALGSLGAVTIGTVLGAVGFCWWTRTRSRRPGSSPASGGAYLSRPASRSSLPAPGETLPLEEQAQVGAVYGFEPSFAESYQSTEQTVEDSSWTDDVTQSDVDQGPVVYVVNF